jgi:hypothetical protein
MPGVGEPEMTGEKTGKQEGNAPSVPGATTEELAKSRKGDRIAPIHYASEVAHEGPRASPDVPSYQCIWEGPAGGYGKKRF